MQCPLTPERWQQYHDTGDAQVKAHLANCARCRAVADEFSAIQRSLASLPVYEAPSNISEHFSLLESSVAGQAFDCRATRTHLEAWRASALDSVQSFLLEEHLFACASCAGELARAEALSTVLQTLPVLDVPLAVAERIAAGRIPWWKRLLSPIPTPALAPRMALAGSLAMGLMLLFGSLLTAPRIADAPITTVATSEPVTVSEPHIAAEPARTVMTPSSTRIEVSNPVQNVRKISVTPQNKRNKIERKTAPKVVPPIEKKPIPVTVATVDDRTVKTAPVVERTVVASAREHIENETRLAAWRTGDMKSYAASELADTGGEAATLVCSL